MPVYLPIAYTSGLTVFTTLIIAQSFFSLVGLCIPELQVSMNIGSFAVTGSWCLSDKET